MSWSRLSKMVSTEWDRKGLEYKFGKDVFKTGFQGEVLPTGSFVVDHLTGIGGIPMGHIIEIFGVEGCGKTTLALTILKNALALKKAVLYEDYESTVGDSYLAKLGIDVDRLKDYRVTPNTMEDGLMMVKMFCADKKHDGGVIVIDSLAAMAPQFDMEKSEEVIGQTKIGSASLVMSIGLKQLTGRLAKSNVSLIFLNQERSNIDIRGMSSGKTTTGGKALRFYSALRFQMDYLGPIVEEDTNYFDEKAGQRKTVKAIKVSVKVIKNKFAPSYVEGQIVLRMDEGIDNLHSALIVAQKLGFISKSSKGGFYELDERYSGDTAGKKKIHGEEKMRSYFLDTKDARDVLMADVGNFLGTKK